MLKLLFFIFIYTFSFALVAQKYPVSISCKLIEDSIATDEKLTFEVVINNLDNFKVSLYHKKRLEELTPIFPDMEDDFIFLSVFRSYTQSWQNTNIISGLKFLVFYRPKKAGVFKIPAFEFAFVGKKYKVEKQKVWVFKAQDDGRFTLGAGERRLMYGFPIPLSTSHFVVKSDDNFASNSRSVQAAKHITTAKRETIAEGKSKYVQMRYYFNNLVIVQKIMPVTANLQLAEENEKVQYYQVVYEIENTDSKEKEVGLTLLIDTMIDGNDAAQIGVANESKLFDTEVVLKDSLPERLWVYEKAANKSKMIGELRNSIDTEKVNEVYIGKWSEFFTTLWDVKLTGERYKDSGILARWTSRKIAPKAKMVLSVYYGLPDFKMADKNNSLGLLFDEPEMVESVEDVIYYTDGSPQLNAKQASKIDKMLKKIPKNDILGISIEGYSDASGLSVENYLLSLLRAESVAAYLRKKGIAGYRLMPKGYGDTFARPTTDKLKAAEDRKVVLRIVYKAK